MESDLDVILKPGAVVMVKIDEVGSQLTRLKDDLKKRKNVKMIYENGRNHRILEDLIRSGKVPILLMGKTSIQNLTENVKARITHIIKTSEYINQEAADMFIF